MRQVITAKILHSPAGDIAWPRIVVQDGLIVELSSGDPNGTTQVLASAFLDIHVHGAVSFDFMSSTAHEIGKISSFLSSKGVARYLATTVTGPVDETLRSLERLASYTQSERPSHGGAEMLGLHLEGPFLCPAKRGVHPLGLLLSPDIPTFERFQEAAQGTIRLITLAPEMPGALELTRYAVAQGVRVSLGHSNATAVESVAGIEAGATSATHTFNAMRSLDHREPGLCGVVLDSDLLFAELIADGVHVHPAMVRLWLKAKGPQLGILVTDGMAATGMPNGTYRLGNLIVEVADGVCKSDGVLAGSVLTMDRAVRNVCEMTGASLAEAVGLASRNPAAMLGLEHLTRIEQGIPATFNVFDEKGRRIGMWLNGQWIPAA